jgi:hypothetical protein
VLQLFMAVMACDSSKAVHAEAVLTGSGRNASCHATSLALCLSVKKKQPHITSNLCSIRVAC